MKKLLFLSLACLILVACANHDKGGAKSEVAQVRFPPPVVKADEDAVVEADPPTVEELKAAEPGPRDEVSAGYSTPKPVGRILDNTQSASKDTAKKIIKEGDISFETGNVSQTRKVIINALKKCGGYVSEENESNNGEESRKEYVLHTRIPAKNFDQFLNAVSSTAVQIDSKNISTQDVTVRYIDISTRLQNKKLLEARYLSLLKQANKMGDILQVENKLSEIRSEIESEQGQLNYLSRQVAYSSLDITFYTRHIAPVDKGYGVGYKLKRALSNGWDTLGNWFFGLISIWPLLLIICILVILFKRWRKRRRAAKA